jgi:hypothetical protein
MGGTLRLGTGVSAEFVQNPAGLIDGIVSGLIQAGPGAMQVQSSSLIVMRNGVQETVPNTTLNVTAADATNPRVDMVQWNGTTLSMKNGTAASITTISAPTPDAGNIPLSLVFIYPNGTTIKDLGQQDATGQFNAIFAYYYARRGLYACLLARQNSSQAFGGTADPVVALPVYNARSGIYRFDYVGSATVADGSASCGLQVIVALDGTSFTGAGGPNTTASQVDIGSASNSACNTHVTYSRGIISAGAHRWNPMITGRVNPTSLNYRQAELQEIL